MPTPKFLAAATAELQEWRTVLGTDDNNSHVRERHRAFLGKQLLFFGLGPSEDCSRLHRWRRTRSLLVLRAAAPRFILQTVYALLHRLKVKYHKLGLTKKLIQLRLLSNLTSVEPDLVSCGEGRRVRPSQRSGCFRHPGGVTSRADGCILRPVE
jgi:hypothetical protein